MPRKHIELLHISFLTLKDWQIKDYLPKPNRSIAPLTLSLLWWVESRLNDYLTKRIKGPLDTILDEVIVWVDLVTNQTKLIEEWNHYLLTKKFQKIFAQIMYASWLKKFIITCIHLHPHLNMFQMGLLLCAQYHIYKYCNKICEIIVYCFFTLDLYETLQPIAIEDLSIRNICCNNSQS